MKDVATYRMYLDSLHDLIRMGMGGSKQANELRRRMEAYEEGMTREQIDEMNAISSALARRKAR